MRVLVLSGAAYGDPARRTLFDHVAARGVEVVLGISARTRYPFFGRDEQDPGEGSHPGVRLERLTPLVTHRNDTHIVLRGVPSLIRRTSPDLIHCAMEPWAITCLQALAVVRTSRRKPFFGVQAAETRLDQGGHLAGTIRKRLFRWVVARCDFFIGWNEQVLNQASRLGLNGAVTSLIPAVGTDSATFRPAGEDEKANLRQEMRMGDPQEFIVGFVGRFVPEKGISDLIAAMDQVVLRYPRAVLAMLGAGPMERGIIEAAASRPWLRLIGTSNRTGVSKFLRGIDLLTLPSRSTPRSAEQFGLVIVEAMCSGIPVVGSTCGAIPEVIGDGGWIFTEGDRGALEAAILGAIEDVDERINRARIARERAIGRYSDEAVAETLVRTWSAAVERVRP